jgi:hypothetical protein
VNGKAGDGMFDSVRYIFSFVCGQDLMHTWAPGGVALPFCQRCTGLYVGAVLAVLLLCLRPALDGRFRRIHVALLFLMAPFGFHLAPEGPFLRTMSGQWFAFGIVGLLWVYAGSVFRRKVEPRKHGTALYLSCGMGSLILLPFLALHGGVVSAFVLPCAGLAGMIVFAALVAAALVKLGTPAGSL